MNTLPPVYANDKGIQIQNRIIYVVPISLPHFFHTTLNFFFAHEDKNNTGLKMHFFRFWCYFLCKMKIMLSQNWIILTPNVRREKFFIQPKFMRKDNVH